MKKTTIKTLKILLDSKSLSASDISDIEQWENEGGKSTRDSDLFKSLAPVKRGEIFEVVGGNLRHEDGKLYFIAEIDILSRY